MTTYYIGRYSVGIPSDMKEGMQLQGLRDFKMTEILLPSDPGEKQEYLEKIWKEIIDKAEKHHDRPNDKKTGIVQFQSFPEIGPWAKGVIRYDGISGRSGTWIVLIDKGKVALMLETPRGFTFANDGVRISIKNLIRIGRAYSPRDRNSKQSPPRGDYFYLQHGVIALPFLWHERVTSEFMKLNAASSQGYDPRDFISIEMDSTYTGQKHSVSDNIASTIESGFAFSKGVKIDRLRSGKRAVAGMDGQEELNRMKDKSKEKASFSFDWEYIAKEDSGEEPGILISMWCPDNGDEKERLKIWDAVLNSMRPMYEK